MVVSLSILDFKNHLGVRVKCFLSFFVEIFFGFKSHPVCDCFKFFPRKISRCSSIFIRFPEKLWIKKFKMKWKYISIMSNMSPKLNMEFNYLFYRGGRRIKNLVGHYYLIFFLFLLSFLYLWNIWGRTLTPRFCWIQLSSIKSYKTT